MAYSDIDFPSKKALKEAVEAWLNGMGPAVTAHQPGGMFPLRCGENTIEGPHYPKPHKWYARVRIEDVIGEHIITKVMK